MDNERLTAYIGFALRSRQVFLGVDNILSANPRRMHLLLLDNQLADNSRQRLNQLATKHNLVIHAVDGLATLAHIDGVKALAIAQPSLATQIIGLLADDQPS